MSLKQNIPSLFRRAISKKLLQPEDEILGKMRSRTQLLVRGISRFQLLQKAKVVTTPSESQRYAFKEREEPAEEESHPKPSFAAQLKESFNFIGEELECEKSAREMFEERCRAAGVQPKVAFIGGGNMGKAMINGFIASGMLRRDQIGVSDPFPQALTSFKDDGITAETNNHTILARFGAGITFLCVKPNILQSVLQQCSQDFKSSGIIVSIVAGATLQTVESQLDCSVPVIRVMPNTPCLVGSGASVLSRNQNTTSAQCELVQSLMETVGTCREVPEYQIDAVTGLSGSGPAYVYTMIDALSDGGVKQGLPRDLAIHLAAQTLMGAAKMVLETGKHPGELKNMVCSPGGTTIAGVHALEEGGIRPALISAVAAATERAKELGAVKSNL